MWTAAVTRPEDLSVLRRRCAALLQDLGIGEHADTVGLLLTELAANALVHGQAPRTAHLRVVGPVVRVEVTDASTDPPVLAAGRPEEPGGQGIRLVAALATDWGCDPRPDGKVVWFELAV